MKSPQFRISVTCWGDCRVDRVFIRQVQLVETSQTSHLTKEFTMRAQQSLRGLIELSGCKMENGRLWTVKLHRP